MYYQQDSVSGAVGVQSTCLATSPDGLTWSHYGPIIDVFGTAGAGGCSEVIGNGLTGYFTPELVGHTIGGPHLISAGDYGLYARSYSNDGRKFLTDPRLLGYSIDLTQHLAGRMISWNHSVTFYYEGVLSWAGIVTNFASGEIPKDGRICLARIAEDRRTLLSRPEVIIDGAGPAESVDMRAVSIY